MYLCEPGRSSLDSMYEIVKDGVQHAEGAARIVWVSVASGRSVPVPESIAGPLRGTGGAPA
jgi:acyl-CoA thioesterase FadM